MAEATSAASVATTVSDHWPTRACLAWRLLPMLCSSSVRRRGQGALVCAWAAGDFFLRSPGKPWFGTRVGMRLGRGCLSYCWLTAVNSTEKYLGDKDPRRKIRKAANNVEIPRSSVDTGVESPFLTSFIFYGLLYLQKCSIGIICPLSFRKDIKCILKA